MQWSNYRPGNRIGGKDIVANTNKNQHRHNTVQVLHKTLNLVRLSITEDDKEVGNRLICIEHEEGLFQFCCLLKLCYCGVLVAITVVFLKSCLSCKLRTIRNLSNLTLHPQGDFVVLLKSSLHTVPCRFSCATKIRT